jgi:FkbM family methyltransferase
VVRLLRPTYEVLLDVVTLGRGYRRTVNQLDTFFIHPGARGLVPDVYEPPVYEHVRRVVQPGWTVLSIGSHVGIYVLLLGTRVQPGGRVIAFEPNPATRRLLASHVRRNRLGRVVEVRPEAVADSSGHMPFVATGVEGYSRLGTPHPEARVTAHRTIRVPVTRVDDFVHARNVRPDLLLVDVEGFEGAVLAGAVDTLRAHPRCRVVVELHPELWPAGEAERIQSVLAALGLAATSLTGQGDPYASHGVAWLTR